MYTHHQLLIIRRKGRRPHPVIKSFIMQHDGRVLWFCPVPEADSSIPAGTCHECSPMVKYDLFNMRCVAGQDPGLQIRIFRHHPHDTVLIANYNPAIVRCICDGGKISCLSGNGVHHLFCIVFGDIPFIQCARSSGSRNSFTIWTHGNGVNFLFGFDYFIHCIEVGVLNTETSLLANISSMLKFRE
jgi:hypothetical protein